MPRRLIRNDALHDRLRGLGGVAVWWIETLVVHGRGDIAGQPIRYGDEYSGFIFDCYALDKRGRRLYDSAFFSRPKGTDKSGVAAALCLFEAFGPCRFAGWAEGGETYTFLGQTYVYSAGEPMGRPVTQPIIRILATEEGQPLALDTPVATPSGWTTVGDLEVGDFVYSSAGEPTRVERTTRVFHDLDCYEVEFSDGEKITASASHAWTLERRNLHSGKHETVTVSTEEMADDYYSAYRGSRYRLQVTPALQAPEADLPVDPYFLGLWLGDGKAADSALTYDPRDHDEMVAAINEMLLEGESAVYSTSGGAGVVRIKREGGRRHLHTLRNRLSDAGVLGNKHIPGSYLRASETQRMAVLQGLMDSDGTIDRAKGRAIFTNADRRLINGIKELLTSLGFKWDERFDASVQAWRVGFQPTLDRPVTRLARKVALHKPASKLRRADYRHVVSVKRVESVPVKCIGIDTDDHLFAAGRRMVLTHNTGNVYDSIYFNLTDEDAPLHQLVKAYGVDAGKTRVLLSKTSGGGSIEPMSSGAASKDGGLETFAVFDESHLYVVDRLKKMYGTITRNLRKRKKLAEPWYIETTTMYLPGEDSIAEETYRLADMIQEGRTRRKRLLFDHRWGEVGDAEQREDESNEEYEKRLSVAFADAYGDATEWNDVEDMLDAFFDPRNSVAEQVRYFFNAVVEASNAWLKVTQWNQIGLKDRVKAWLGLGDKITWRPPRKGEKITLGFDGSRSDDATALVACRVSDGYVWPIIIEEAPDDEASKHWTVDQLKVDKRVREMFKKFTVVGFFADPPYWQDYVDAWDKDFGDQLVVRGTRDKGIHFYTSNHKAMAQAVERAHTAILAGNVIHGNDLQMTRHVMNARRWERNGGDVIGKEKRGSKNKMDAAMALVLALEARARYLAKERPEEEQFVPFNPRGGGRQRR